MVLAKFPESVFPGYRAVKQMLMRGEVPRAIVAMNDWIAVGLLMGLKEEGLSVPDDVAIVSFDDLEWASYINPGLTTVKSPVYDIGVKAATHIINLIEKKEAEIVEEKLPMELIVRESCGADLN